MSLDCPADLTCFSHVRRDPRRNGIRTGPRRQRPLLFLFTSIARRRRRAKEAWPTPFFDVQGTQMHATPRLGLGLRLLHCIEQYGRSRLPPTSSRSRSRSHLVCVPYHRTQRTEYYVRELVVTEYYLADDILYPAHQDGWHAWAAHCIFVTTRPPHVTQNNPNHRRCRCQVQ